MFRSSFPPLFLLAPASMHPYEKIIQKFRPGRILSPIPQFLFHTNNNNKNKNNNKNNNMLTLNVARVGRGGMVQFVRWGSSSSEKQPLLLEKNENQVKTITLNKPKTLNAWTMPMMNDLKKTMQDAAICDNTKVVILTGTDPYYSAGVALNSLIKPMHPKKLFKILEGKNAELFDIFLTFPKPIIAAINGPTIGAATTSAALCDALIASENATFHTPFAALHIPPEGCSSVHFERIMGEENARRMLGQEGWKPTGAEAAEIGLATTVVPHDDLLPHSQALAEKWIKEGKKREIRKCDNIEEYKQVNLEESRQLATAFFSTEFLMNQYNFLQSKGKTQPARTMWLVAKTRPLWSKLL